MTQPASFSTDELFRWVELQVAMGARRPGSSAGRANEDFLFEELRRFGLSEVRREVVPVTHWRCEAASLLVGSEEVPVFGIPYTKFSPDEGTTAPLVFAEPKALSSRADWRGKIVVAEIGFPQLDAELLMKLALGQHDPRGKLELSDRPATWIRVGWHFYRWAAKRGAAGFVGILKDQPGGTCEMYAPYGFKEKDILAKPIPGLWASRRDGARLRQWAEAGKSARLTLSGTHEPALSHNIVGEIPGKTDEVLVLSTHHDSPFISPVEDASGVAVVLALARHLAQVEKMRRTVVVLFSSGHFYGSIGTRSFIAKHRQDIVTRTALEISIEHIALEAAETREGTLKATGLAEPVGLFIPLNRTLRDVLLKNLAMHEHGRALVLPAEGPLGDYPPTDGGDWYEAGVPVINYISNPSYLLTNDDALRWVDRNGLAQVAQLFADVIQELDQVSRHQLARVDFPLKALLMKILKHVVRARSTSFGRKPLH